MKLMDALTFNEQGLIPVIIANVEDSRPLTLCYMNRDALEKTIETGKVHVFRRSKGRLMLKGETSGHIQEVKGVFPGLRGPVAHDHRQAARRRLPRRIHVLLLPAVRREER